MIPKAYQMYQQSAVQTASGPQLLLMLYDGGIRFLKGAIDALNRKDIQSANQNLLKSQAVINELIASLDLTIPVSKDLVRVYDYMLYQLIQANMKKDRSKVEEVLQFMIELRETWHQASRAAAGHPQTT